MPSYPFTKFLSRRKDKAVTLLTAPPPIRLSTGAAVAVTGRWTPSLGKGQTHELQAESVRVLGENDAAVSQVISLAHNTNTQL